jgi:hypothetical protein
MKLSMYLIILFSISICFAQVGIGTTNPKETLHINGTVRIENTTSNIVNATSLTGFDTNGTINKVQVGQNLSLSNGILTAKMPTGPTTYGVATITDNFANQTLHNYDLDLDGVNSDKTVFILRQTAGMSAQPTTISGLSGGTNGRVIILKSDTNNLNISIQNQSTSSNPENRFMINESTRGVNAFGSITLIYVGSMARWQILNLQI